MDSILRTSIAKYFVAVVCLVALVLGLVRYLALPWACGEGIECSGLSFSRYSFAASLIDNFLITAMVTLAFSLFMFWLEPSVARTASLEPIGPIGISEALRKSLVDTTEWIYKGGTGTYLKAITLPENAKYAREQRKSRDISIEMIDPTNDSMCRAYSDYRRALASHARDGSEGWTVDRVKREAYATILMVVIMRAEEPLLRIKLGLSRTFSTFRYDMSSSYLIITNEDKRAPAIKVDKGTYFYDEYKEDLRRSFEQSRIVQVDRSEGLSRQSVTPANVESIFRQIGLISSDAAQLKLDEVIALALSPDNPYA